MQDSSTVPYVTVQIGPAAGDILETSQDGIRYRDEAHREYFLDLTDYKGKDRPVVGPRVLDGGWSQPEEPPYYVLVCGKNLRVQFAFTTYEAAYAELLNALHECGYRTIDLT